MVEDGNVSASSAQLVVQLAGTCLAITDGTCFQVCLSESLNAYTSLEDFLRLALFIESS